MWWPEGREGVVSSYISERPCALLWQASAGVGPDELPYYAALHKARVY